MQDEEQAAKTQRSSRWQQLREEAKNDQGFFGNSMLLSASWMSFETH